MKNNYDGVIEDWKADLIIQRARRKGFRPDEIQEVQQEVAVAVMAFRFDSDKANGASERTAIISLIDKQLTFIIRGRARRHKAMQRYRDEVLGHEPTATEHAEHERLWDMQQDVRHSLNQLPERDRAVCEALANEAPRVQIAKDLGVSRYEVDRIIDRIRDTFRGWGLDAWVLA